MSRAFLCIYTPFGITTRVEFVGEDDNDVREKINKFVEEAKYNVANCDIEWR